MAGDDAMTTFARAAIGGLALAATLGFQASAADYRLPAPPPLEGPRPLVSELGAGWYLRGDIGYAVAVDPSVTLTQPLLGLRTPYTNEKIDPGFTIGGGFGYKFLNWLRADVTADYRLDTDFSGALGPFPQRATLSGWTTLGNVYLDLGSWYGISPYIGAGAGVAQVQLRDYFDNLTGVGTGTDKWSFAWALMGGVAVQVSPGFSLDLGYRYLSIANTDLNLIAGVMVNAKDLASHEFRIGVRYMIE